MGFPEQWYRDDYDHNVFLQHKEHLKVWKEVNNSGQGIGVGEAPRALTNS